MKRLVFIVTVFFFIAFARDVVASIGVGVGTGKIQVDEKLKPGTIYQLPALGVLNTGDEESDYEVIISYHEKQPELKPQNEWFDFSPQKFHLEPGKIQNVSIKLNLPIKAEPGQYFAYLEAHPVKSSPAQTTTIGIAAATKLYFEITPGNIFSGIYYKILGLLKNL